MSYYKKKNLWNFRSDSLNQREPHFNPYLQGTIKSKINKVSILQEILLHFLHLLVQ